MTVELSGPGARFDEKRAPRAGLSRRLGAWCAPPALVVWLTIGLVLPVVTVVAQSFGDPPWATYQELLRDRTLWTVCVRTLGLALIATAATVVLGFPTAYALTLVGPRLRIVLFGLLVVPYVTSLLVRSYAWIGLLGVRGPVSQISEWLGHERQSFVGTSLGVVLTLVHVFLPFVILTTYVSMSRINPTHMRAAESLGAGRLEAFWSIYAPQARPGVVAGGLLAFIISVGMFAIPALVGGPDQTTIAMIVVQQVTAGYGLPQDKPAALAVLLCLLVLLILAAGSRAIGLSSLLGVDAASDRPTRSSRRHPIKRSAWTAVAARIPSGRRHRHLLVTAATVLSLVIVVAPFIFLLGVSFQPLPLIQLPTDDWSLRWYRKVLEDQMWLTAARNSLQIGIVAAALAVLVGGYLASLTLRSRRLVSRALMTVTLAPLIIPTVMYATGAYIVFVRFHFIGNWVAIAVAHSILALPFAYVNMLNGLVTYDRRLDDAAASLGASAVRRLLRVKLPVLRPAILSAALLAFLVSLDEFVVTLFLSGISYTTLPLGFWTASRDNLSPALAVVGVLLVMLVLLVGAGGVVARERGARASVSVKKERSE